MAFSFYVFFLLHFYSHLYYLFVFRMLDSSAHRSSSTVQSNKFWVNVRANEIDERKYDRNESERCVAFHQQINLSHSLRRFISNVWWIVNCLIWFSNNFLFISFSLFLSSWIWWLFFIIFLDAIVFSMHKRWKWSEIKMENSLQLIIKSNIFAIRRHRFLVNCTNNSAT